MQLMERTSMVNSTTNNMLLELDHLSPSHINTFIENRPNWFARYFRDKPYSSNLNTARGHAVEAGIVHYLTVEQDITESIKAGLEEYEKKIKGIKDDITYRQSIGPMIKTAIEGTDKQAGYEVLLLKYGAPETQKKISVMLEGCDIPIEGYLDFFWPKKKVVDNKCTKRNPDSLSQGYIVQGAIYKLATGLPVYFLYEIANKTPTLKEIKLSDEDYQFGIALATRAAKAIQMIVNNPIDGRLMEALMFPDPSGGYGGDEAKELCKFLGLDVFTSADG